MILLSRLIKSATSYIDKQQSKVITIRQFGQKINEEDTKEEIEIPVVNQVDTEEIIKKAEQEAEQIIAEANNYRHNTIQEIEQLKQQWEQERLQLNEIARQEGFQAGLEEGRMQGLHQYKDL